MTRDGYVVVDSSGDVLVPLPGFSLDRAKHVALAVAGYPVEPGERDLRHLEVYAVADLDLALVEEQPLSEWTLVGRTTVQYPGDVVWENVVDVRPLTRTVLVHLNVEVPAEDPRTAEQIGRALMGALEVGSDDESVYYLRPALALADEV
jgi:hypothetical protein